MLLKSAPAHPGRLREIASVVDSRVSVLHHKGYFKAVRHIKCNDRFQCAQRSCRGTALRRLVGGELAEWLTTREGVWRGVDIPADVGMSQQKAARRQKAATRSQPGNC